MNFVTFHVERPIDKEQVHPNTTSLKQNYIRMIDLLFRSAKLFHQDSTCFLLTDLATNAEAISFPHHAVRRPVDYSTLMWSRTLAQQYFIESSDFSQPIILIDSDIIINGSLKPLFWEDFDVALTWRKSAIMPINGGLIILNNKRPDAAISFFDRFVACYRDQYSPQATWYGDQLALRDCVGLNHRQMSESRIVTIAGAKILLLPCETYNYSPTNAFGAIRDRLPDKVILHFKGRRKRLMELFWDCHLLPIEDRNFLAWIKNRLAIRDLDNLISQEEIVSRKTFRY